MKEIWDTYVEHSFGEKKQAEFRYSQFSNNYKKFFPEDKKALVLDIGIGRGEMLTCMKNWGYVNYQGVDISSSTIQFCQSLELNCVLTKDTACWLRQEGKKFDVITLLDVLEHFKKEDVISFLKVINDSLSTKGVLIIQVPNLQCPNGYLHRYNDITHEIGFIQHSLEQVLLVSGFRDIKFYGFETLLNNSFQGIVKRFIRAVFWRFIKFSRMIEENLNPEILHPVFYAVCIKNDTQIEK